MSDLVAIHLAAWIIQDGNYGDFREGQQRPFALEVFAPEPLTPVSEWEDATPRYSYKGSAEYSIFGRCTFDDPEWSVLDFGLPAYSSYAMHGQSHPVGKVFRGRVYLGIDHFAYFERLSKAPSAPPLIMDWKVQRIEIQKAPFIESGGILRRDPTKLSWRQVKETNAWEDDNGYAEYLLHCERIGMACRHTLQD